MNGRNMGFGGEKKLNISKFVKTCNFIPIDPEVVCDLRLDQEYQIKCILNKSDTVSVVYQILLRLLLKFFSQEEFKSGQTQQEMGIYTIQNMHFIWCPVQFYVPHPTKIRYLKFTSIDTTCVLSSPTPMFEHLLE